MLEDEAKLLLGNEGEWFVGRDILEDDTKLLVGGGADRIGMVGAGARVQGGFHVTRAEVEDIAWVSWELLKGLESRG